MDPYAVMNPAPEEMRDRLYSLVVMETALDEEIEKRETEYHWDRKKYVYLQALECDPEHLETLSKKVQSSLGVINMFKYLLEETFKEKMMLIDMLSHQNPDLREEDENLPDQPISHEPVASYPQINQTKRHKKHTDQMYFCQTKRGSAAPQRVLALKHSFSGTKVRLIPTNKPNSQKRKLSCKDFKRDIKAHWYQGHERVYVKSQQGRQRQYELHRKLSFRSRKKLVQRPIKAITMHPKISSRFRNSKCLECAQPLVTAKEHNHLSLSANRLHIDLCHGRLSNQNSGNIQSDERLFSDQRQGPQVGENDRIENRQSSNLIQPISNDTEENILFGSRGPGRAVQPLPFSNLVYHVDEMVEDFHLSENRS